MKKILFVCNGDNFSESAFEYARSLHEEEGILLKGFFLPTIDYSGVSSFAYANAYESGMMLSEYLKEESEAMDKSIAQFEGYCQKNNILHKVYKHTGFEALQSLLIETRFSDMCIVGSEHFMAGLSHEQPNTEMSEFLHGTECPVLLTPETFKEPKEIIFAYDGGDACMAAIKQFSRLMKKYSRLPLTVAHFVSSGENIPGAMTATEYIACHFPGFTIKVINRSKTEDLDAWLSEFSDPLLITGAYSRSGISRFFRKSFARGVIAEHKIPLFIFHSKNS